MSASALHAGLVTMFGADAGDALYRWMAVDHPTWARTNAGRLEQVRVACAKMEGAQVGP